MTLREYSPIISYSIFYPIWNCGALVGPGVPGPIHVSSYVTYLHVVIVPGDSIHRILVGDVDSILCTKQFVGSDSVSLGCLVVAMGDFVFANCQIYVYYGIYVIV